MVSNCFLVQIFEQGCYTSRLNYYAMYMPSHFQLHTIEFPVSCMVANFKDMHLKLEFLAMASIHKWCREVDLDMMASNATAIPINHNFAKTTTALVLNS